VITRIRAIAALLASASLVAALSAAPASAAMPAWAPLAASGPTVLPSTQSEVQRLGVDAEAGTFTLSFDGQATAAIDFDAEASEVEAALEALSTIGGAGGGVSVLGGPGNRNGDHPYFVRFDGGSLALSDVKAMTANSGGLLGGGTHTAVLTTTVPGGAGTTDIGVYAQNVGGAESLGPVTAKVKLPAGVTSTGVNHSPGGWSGCFAPAQVELTCTYSGQVGPGLPASPLVFEVVANPAAVSGIVSVEVSGGGAVKAGKFEMPLEIGPNPASPGIQSFTAGAYDENGVLDTRAGAHPANAVTGIMVNSKRNALGILTPAGDPKDIFADLPPGFLGNPIAVPQCSDAADVKTGECPKETTVGVTKPIIETLGGGIAGNETVHNIQAPFGYPAKVKFSVGLGSVLVNVLGELRSDQDYGVSFGSPNTVQIAPVFGVFFDFWGDPASPSHNAQRGGPSGAPSIAFTTQATDCPLEALVPPQVTLRFNTWQLPGTYDTSTVVLPPVSECGKLEFDADFSFEPSDTKSDSPASFRTELAVPSEGLTDPSKLTTPEIRETVVKLPEGVTLNPSGADGLGACSEQQIGLKGTEFPLPNPIRFTKDPNRCPDSSKIGSGELKSALLENPLHGALYLAAQGEGNPFGSLFAVYLVIEDPQTGIYIKLPGEVEPDKRTGQFQVTFRNLPQLPFTYLKLNLKGGNRSALASPTTCGTFATTAVNTPWSYPDSGPPTESANGFEINQGPNGMPCAKTPQERPFDIGLRAGSESTAAGAHTPFSFLITRPDGSQELDSLELRTPPGFSASLKGIPYCPEAAIAAVGQKTGRAEQESSSCPAASQIGRTLTAAGAGPTPFYSGGKLYLAGPYKGAPLSVLAITPALAGPFDLGNVVVRTALFVDRQSAQVTSKTDPIPQILEGVPLRIKEVRVILDRPNFGLNPTSCDASSVSVTAHGNSGAVATPVNRFKVEGCESLGFAPKLSAKVIGGTKRGKHPAFEANLTYPEGSYANIKDVQVALPHSEFLEQAHINTICTRPQAAANACPAGAIYGYAEATTPLLDGKLTGPVFLKSSVHKLPDLAIYLRGPDSQPVEVEFQGRVDSVKGQIRNTIEGLPDVPVSSFRLYMKGGGKGLLINSRDLCKGKPGRLTVKMLGQNNKSSETRPKLGNSCGKKSGKAKKHKRVARRVRFAGPISPW
jgi:hypothetical protein